MQRSSCFFLKQEYEQDAAKSEGEILYDGNAYFTVAVITWFSLLAKDADWFVDGAAGIAERFGIPQLIIGLTVVAMGTSAPEAAVSITAAIKGNADITMEILLEVTF